MNGKYPAHGHPLLNMIPPPLKHSCIPEQYVIPLGAFAVPGPARMHRQCPMLPGHTRDQTAHDPNPMHCTMVYSVGAPPGVDAWATGITDGHAQATCEQT